MYTNIDSCSRREDRTNRKQKRDDNTDSTRKDRAGACYRLNTTRIACMFNSQKSSTSLQDAAALWTKSLEGCKVFSMATLPNDLLQQLQLSYMYITILHVFNTKEIHIVVACYRCYTNRTTRMHNCQSAAPIRSAATCSYFRTL